MGISNCRLANNKLTNTVQNFDLKLHESLAAILSESVRDSMPHFEISAHFVNRCFVHSEILEKNNVLDSLGMEKCLVFQRRSVDH